MADTERIPLQHGAGWVDIKTRWTYGDKLAVGNADPGKTNLTMLQRCIVAWSRTGPEGDIPLSSAAIETLDDTDTEHIIDKIVEHRTAQFKELSDPNSSRASSQTSPEERSGPNSGGSPEPASAQS